MKTMKIKVPVVEYPAVFPYYPWYGYYAYPWYPYYGYVYPW
jgi:hypothetical protein